jgi:hypothetical protein
VRTPPRVGRRGKLNRRQRLAIRRAVLTPEVVAKIARELTEEQRRRPASVPWWDFRDNG